MQGIWIKSAGGRKWRVSHTMNWGSDVCSTEGSVGDVRCVHHNFLHMQCVEPGSWKTKIALLGNRWARGCSVRMVDWENRNLSIIVKPTADQAIKERSFESSVSINKVGRQMIALTSPLQKQYMMATKNPCNKNNGCKLDSISQLTTTKYETNEIGYNYVTHRVQWQ